MDVSTSLLGLNHHFLTMSVLSGVKNDMVGGAAGSKELYVTRLTLIGADRMRVAVRKLSVSITAATKVDSTTSINDISDKTRAIETDGVASRARVNAARITGACAQRRTWTRTMSTSPAIGDTGTHPVAGFGNNLVSVERARWSRSRTSNAALDIIGARAMSRVRLAARGTTRAGADAGTGGTISLARGGVYQNDVGQQDGGD